MKNTNALLLAFLFLFNQGFAQSISPAPAQSQSIAVTGATIHLGNGQVISNGIVVFENGKFSQVLASQKAQAVRATDMTIDASGKHLYPGFISMNTNLGLVEIGAVRATNDYRETGQLNPSVRSLIAYNTDSEVIPTVRSNGVLMAEIAPQGGMISGQSSLVQLDAWNWEDAELVADLGIHVRWPRKKRWNWRERKAVENKNYGKTIREFENFLTEAKVYAFKTNPNPTNLKMEAMQGIFKGDKKMFMHVQNASEIREAVLSAKRAGITPVIVGGRDSWMMTEFLKENNVPVILGATQSLPGNEDADIDQPFKTPAILQEAGVLFSISEGSHWRERNLPFQAGQAVAFGLNKEVAVQSISENAAKILGVENSVGTIEVGKDATFFISSGDALDMRGNDVTEAFIQGRKVNLDNKQKALARKFRGKYGTDEK